MKKDYIAYLKNIFERYVTFNEDEWESARCFLNIQTWGIGDHFFKAGEYPRKVYFLVEGRARYFYVTADGKEKNKSIVRIGDALACMNTLINNDSCPFYTQALSGCTTVSIDYSDFVMLADKYSKWNLLVRKILERLALKKERREASFLTLSARQRYEEFLADFGDEAEEIPLKHVAMYLGITDVALSRIRNEMGLT
jgi:CRP-like cAMP-binding protein